MSEKEYEIIPIGSATAKFECGHEGPAQHDAVIFGHNMRLNPKNQDQRELCPDCLMKKALEGATKCAKCSFPIFKGSSCIDYPEDGICCLSRECGLGPMAAMPGIWDGTRFVDGFTAGSVVCFPIKRG